jgi:hypothetical protein
MVPLPADAAAVAVRTRDCVDSPTSGEAFARVAGYIASVGNTAGDRLIIAEISGVSARHVPLSGAYPRGESAAIGEVKAVARGRPDLLAQFAGTCLGWSIVHPVDHLAAQLVGQASGWPLELARTWIWWPGGFRLA